MKRLRLLRCTAMLAVVLAVSELGQVWGKKYSEEGSDDDDVDVEDQDGDVEVLTADAFAEQTESGLPLLVYYYTKWCKHCVTTGPMIDALAVLLRDRDDLALRVAKVDVEAQKALAENQGVSGFPTIRMYKDGRHDDFYGDRSVPDLVKWLERKMGVSLQTPKSAGEARQLLAANPVVVVGFFLDADSEEAAVFKTASTLVDKVVFALVDDEQLLAEFGAKDGTVAVFKKFDEGRVDLRVAHSADTLAMALKRTARPLVADYHSDNAMEHFSAAGMNGNRTVLVIFLSRRANHYAQLHDALQATALERANNVSFLTVDVDVADNAPVLTALGVTNSTAMPAMRIYSFASGQRYKPATDRLTGDSVRDFVAGVLGGALASIDDTEEAQPAEQAVKDENGVTVLTAATFDQAVYDGRRHALVLFYTDNCMHCIDFKPIFDEVAGQVAHEPMLMMSKINMGGRSRPKSTGVEIVGVPYVVMYPRCAKEKPVVFEGARSAKGLLKFIKKHTGVEARKPRKDKEKPATASREEL